MSLASGGHVLKLRRSLTGKPRNGPRLFHLQSNTAEFSAAAATLDQVPKLYGRPEVIVTGRANCGKSTLFNAVLGKKDLLRTSKKAGCTQTLNFYTVGAHPGSAVLVDAPGYGARGRPEWGSLFNSYLSTRTQLKRIYILFNGKHLLNSADVQMLAHLSETLMTQDGVQPYTLQAVITKVDCIPHKALGEVIPKIRKQIWEAAPLCLPPIITSAAMRPMLGIDAVRANIAEACGLGLLKK